MFVAINDFDGMISVYLYSTEENAEFNVANCLYGDRDRILDEQTKADFIKAFLDGNHSETIEIWNEWSREWDANDEWRILGAEVDEPIGPMA